MTEYWTILKRRKDEKRVREKEKKKKVRQSFATFHGSLKKKLSTTLLDRTLLDRTLLCRIF
jgi:hypothetical protein